MSLECSECERDLRGPHDESCSRYQPYKSFVCGIAEHNKCDGHAPEDSDVKCACSCHDPSPEEIAAELVRWAASCPPMPPGVQFEEWAIVKASTLRLIIAEQRAAEAEAVPTRKTFAYRQGHDDARGAVFNMIAALLAKEGSE